MYPQGSACMGASPAFAAASLHARACKLLARGERENMQCAFSGELVVTLLEVTPENVGGGTRR